MRLAERLVAIHDSLEAERIPHAFGGAIALAYWTRNPRGTNDIDVNVFLGSGEAIRGLDALPGEVSWGAAEQSLIERDGQARLWWDETPVDVFFDYHEIHRDAARNRQWVPFAGTEIPILGPNELAIFKAMFDRTRDWADLEEMAEQGSFEPEKVAAALAAMVGEADPRTARLAEAVERGRAGRSR